MDGARDTSADLRPRLAELRAALLATASEERAAQERRYLKSDLVFLGVTVPEVRRVAKRYYATHPDLDRAAWRALATVLWQTRVHEQRSVAIALLELARSCLVADDAPWLIDLVRQANTWAHVDWLATKVIGALLEREPRVDDHLDAWAKDPCFWVRRAALLAPHDALLAGRGDLARFTALAVPLLGEREFFIRKAIGWVLRSTSKRTPDRTIAFVEAHADAMSALSFREATRNLPPRDRERLEALRRGARAR